MKLGVKVQAHANYGIDAPEVLRNLIISGVVCFLLSRVASPLGWLIQPAISFFATAGVWIYGSKVGKLRVRDRMVGRHSWRGDERALDVGCGSGLLLIAAAKRLTTGEAVGIDIWNKRDLSNSGPQAALRNASVEGVAERVKIQEADVRQLPFANESFDIALSLNVLHNIPRLTDREKALHEILRVLKPGGRVILTDFRNTREYVRVLRDAGMTDARRELVYWLFIPLFAVIAGKGNA